MLCRQKVSKQYQPNNNGERAAESARNSMMTNANEIMALAQMLGVSASELAAAREVFLKDLRA